MQAGEQLNFIQPPGQRPAEVEYSHEKTTHVFRELCVDLINNFSGNLKDVEVEIGPAELYALEAPLRIQYDDGSYLHILAYVQAVPEIITSLGITIAEHDMHGSLIAGFTYTSSDRGFARERVNPLYIDANTPDTTHYSLVGDYEGLYELEVLESSEDMEQHMMAQEIRHSINESNQFDNLEKEMGFDGIRPSYSEILKLADLLQYAEPYTPPADHI